MTNVLPIAKVVSDEKFMKAFEAIDFNTPKEINKLEEQRSSIEKVVTFTDITKANHIYRDDYNRLAQSITFGRRGEFVKFYVPINLFTVEDIYEERKLHSERGRNERSSRARQVSKVNQMRVVRDNNRSYQGSPSTPIRDFEQRLITNEQRGNLQRTNLEVYVNGTKIPDCDILLTVVNGTVDVYFESRHLKEKKNELVFILKKHSHVRPYRVQYLSSRNSVEDLDMSSKKIYNVYKNGLYLIPNKDYKVQNDRFIYNGNLLDDEIIEILEVNYNCYYPDVYINNYTGLIETEDIRNKEGQYLKHYNKAISKEIIELYVDGKRYMPDKIEDITATYFIIKDDFTGGKNIYYRVMFEDYEFEDKNIDYLDQYKKATNFFAKRLIIDKMLNNGVNVEMPEYFELNNMNENYLPEYLGNFLKDPLSLQTDKDLYLYGLLKNYVMRNSYYLKHIAKQFTVRPEEYTTTFTKTSFLDAVRMDTSQELPDKYYEKFKSGKVLFSFSCPTDKGFYVEKVYVNGRFLNRDQYRFKTNERNMVFLYIDMDVIISCFKDRSKNSNPVAKIQCFMERCNNNDSVSYTFEYTGRETDLTKFIDLDEFNINQENYKELVVAVKYDDWDYYKQLNEDEYDFQLVLIDGKIKLKVKVLSNYLPKYTSICVYNPLFVRRNNYILPEDSDELEGTYIIDLETLYPDIKTSPTFSKGLTNPNIEIYYDGLRVFEGMDYQIVLPTFDNRLETPRLLLKFVVAKGKQLVIINKENKENLISSKYKLTSKYGLVYLGEIKQPYSEEYMTVYLNGQMINPENIEFIANNFIRIHNLESVYGLNIVSHVNMPQELEDELYNFSLLNKESFEEYLKKFLTNSDYFAPSIDDIFEAGKDVENKTEEEKNEILKPIDPDLGDRFDRVDIGINSVIDSFLKGFIQKRIDANKEIDQNDIMSNLYFDFFSTNIVPLDANERVLVLNKEDANQFEILQEAIGLDANDNYYDKDQIAELFVQEQIKNVQEDIDGDLDDFEKSNMNKYIYPENDITLDANTEFKNIGESVPLDANDSDLEQEGIQPHDGVIVFDSNF